MRPLASHGRYPYLPITRRGDYDWPDGARLAVYIGLNLEHFEFGRGLGAKLAPSGEPDVLNYAWRDYGNRIGVWRCIELFDRLRLPLGVLVNTSLYDHCPEVPAAFRPGNYRWGAEVIGHGHTNAERQGDLSEADERVLIASCRERIRNEQGQAPRGWLSPWISESVVTPDLLKECGFDYTLDWCHDDQPLPMQTRAGPLWSIPYPQEVNDIPMIVARQMQGDAFARLILDTFDEMREQSRLQPLVMGIALHPYLVGQPARLRHLRDALEAMRRVAGIWWCTPGQILDHVKAIDAGKPRDSIE
jgi:allantoinase